MNLSKGSDEKMWELVIGFETKILIREVFMLQNRPTQSYPPFVSERWRKPQIEMSVHMIFSFRFVPWHERLYLYMYLFRLLTLALCIWFISWWAYKCEYEKQETSFQSLGIRRWRERREKRRKYIGKLSVWATLSFERRKTVLSVCELFMDKRTGEIIRCLFLFPPDHLRLGCPRNRNEY